MVRIIKCSYIYIVMCVTYLLFIICTVDTQIRYRIVLTFLRSRQREGAEARQ